MYIAESSSFVPRLMSVPPLSAVILVQWWLSSSTRCDVISMVVPLWLIVWRSCQRCSLAVGSMSASGSSRMRIDGWWMMRMRCLLFFVRD